MTSPAGEPQRQDEFVRLARDLAGVNLTRAQAELDSLAEFERE